MVANKYICPIITQIMYRSGKKGMIIFNKPTLSILNFKILISSVQYNRIYFWVNAKYWTKCLICVYKLFVTLCLPYVRTYLILFLKKKCCLIKFKLFSLAYLVRRKKHLNRWALLLNDIQTANFPCLWILWPIIETICLILDTRCKEFDSNFLLGQRVTIQLKGHLECEHLYYWELNLARASQYLWVGFPLSLLAVFTFTLCIHTFVTYLNWIKLSIPIC